MNKKYEFQCIVGGRSGGKTFELKKMLAIKEFEEKYNCNWIETDYINIQWKKEGYMAYNCYFDIKEKTFEFGYPYTENCDKVISLDFIEDLLSILHLYYLGDKENETD